MARWSQSRRVTPERASGAELPSLRRRNPLAYWVLLFLAASLVAGPLIFLLQELF